MVRILPGQAFAPRKTQGFRDPGLSVNPDQFGAGVGRAVTQSGEQLGNVAKEALEKRRVAAERLQNRRDTIDRLKRKEGLSDELDALFEKTSTEQDTTDPKVLSSVGKEAQGITDRFNTEHRAAGASEDSALRFDATSQEAVAAFRDRLGVESVTTGKVIIAIAEKQAISRLSDAALDDPTNLPALFDALDAIADDMAPGQTADEEMQFRVDGRAAIAQSAVESFLGQGAFREAQTILDDPGVMGSLSPETQRTLKSRIAVFERAEATARTAGERKLRELETILGRKATPAERVRAAGVAAPAGRQTPASKIAEMEEALGRPLSAPERERVAGLEPVAAVSPEGKVVQDRNLFVEEFGEDSEQVQAFDEATRDTGAPSLGDVAGQRKEFTKLSSVFVNVRDSFNRVTASVRDSSPAGDLALIFNFMKILDPGSVVRESEFAQAAATGSFGQRLQAAGERLLAGKRLIKEQRTDFADRAEMLMRAQTLTHLRLEAQFRDLAVRSGFNPADTVIDFVGPFRAAMGGQPLPTGPASAPVAPKPRFKVDLQGNIIGGP